MTSHLSTFDEAVSRHQTRLAELHLALDRITDSVMELQARLHAYTQAIRLKVDCDACSIYLLDREEKELVLKASMGLAPSAVDSTRLKFGEGVTGWVAEHLEAVALADAEMDPRFKYLPETREERYRSLLSVPIVAEQTFVGVINVQHETVHAFTEYERLLVSAVGYKVGAMVRAHRMEQELDRRQAHLDALLWLSQSATGGQRARMAALVGKARRATGARGGIARLYRPDTGVLEVAATDGMGRIANTLNPLSLGEGIAGHVATTGLTVRVNDYPGFADQLVAVQAVTDSLLCVPVASGPRLVGTVSLFDKADQEGPVPFDSADEKLLTGLVRLAFPVPGGHAPPAMSRQRAASGSA